MHREKNGCVRSDVREWEEVGPMPEWRAQPRWEPWTTTGAVYGQTGRWEYVQVLFDCFCCLSEVRNKVIRWAWGGGRDFWRWELCETVVGGSWRVTWLEKYWSNAKEQRGTLEVHGHDTSQHGGEEMSTVGHDLLAVAWVSGIEVNEAGKVPALTELRF